MSATGIGAAVRRKEDFRFITGKGQYTDDVNRPGQTYIHFLRSPHAHAKIKVDYEVLPAVADPAAAQAKGAPQIHEVAPSNTIYQWHLGDANAVDAAFKAAKHVSKLDILNNRLVPNAMEPRAAIGDY